MKKALILLLLITIIALWVKVHTISTEDSNAEIVNLPVEEIFENQEEIVEDFNDLIQEALYEFNGRQEYFANRGFYYIALENGEIGVLVCMGEKPTGGYSISPIAARDENGVLVITVRETSPKEGETVTCAFTYPFCYVTLIQQYRPENISVVNTLGESFINLSMK